MHKIIYRVVTKAELEEKFKKLAEDVLVPEALKIQGCKLFSFFQNTTNPREFMFYEQWDRHADVEAYKQNLITILGEAKQGEEFPAKMNDLIEEDEDLIYGS